MNQDWINALLGGGLLGLASTLLLLANGKICGISGILFNAMQKPAGGFLWRIKFLTGLILAGLIYRSFEPEAFVNETSTSLGLATLAGLFVGFGTRLGSGCTSGHGICGISRLSARSMVATFSFILTGGATVFLLNYLRG